MPWYTSRLDIVVRIINVIYDRLTLKYGFSISSTTITFNLISDSSSKYTYDPVQSGISDLETLSRGENFALFCLKSFPENEFIVDEHVESDAPKTALIYTPAIPGPTSANMYNDKYGTIWSRAAIQPFCHGSQC